MTDKDVAVREEQAVAIQAEQDDFFSQMDTEDFNVPFTRVLADLSATVKDGTHSAGLIYNTGSGEAVSDMNVVLIKRPDKTIIVKTDDGDFVASHPYSKELIAELTASQDGLKRWDAEGNGIFETWNYYIMDLDTEEISICPMMSSNFSIAKAWNTKVRLQKNNAPSDIVWNLSTKEKPNGKKSFWMFNTPSKVGLVPDDKKEAVMFAKEMLATANVDHSKAFDGDSETAEESAF